MGSELILKAAKESGVLPVIFGATASGKTALTIALSRLLPIEIISADSRQVYKHMAIGTAKPSADEIATVPHHFVDFIPPDETYSAGKFGDEAEQCTRDIVSRGRIPVVCGGSGLYIKALCEGFFDEGKFDYSEIRSALAVDLESRGIDALYEELRTVDPESWALYSDKNPRRILRALEYYRAHSTPISHDHTARNKTRNFRPLYFFIDWQRDELYARINLRTELMWRQGLSDEARALLGMGYSPEMNSLNTVGYKETFDFLSGKLTEPEAIAEIQKNTRHYAKRQLTWFRRYSEATALSGGSPEVSAKLMANLLETECSKIIHS